MAKAIVSHPSPAASKPVTSTSAKILAGALSSELDAAHLATERLFNVINVIVESLYNRNADTDHGLAICLENAVEVELNPAKDRIHDALKLIAEVSHG